MGAGAPFIVGNWKMHLRREEASLLARSIIPYLQDIGVAAEVAVCPPFIWLDAVKDALEGSQIILGAQDCHPQPEGAYTGDISAPMLRDAGCDYVIVGHSERRTLHGESSAEIREKAEAIFAAGMAPIICVGESQEERDAGQTIAVIREQCAASVPDAQKGIPVIAYEPIWAIGSGKTPSLDEIARVHTEIHGIMVELGFASGALRVLYGGSVKPGNAAEILALPGVEGALIGGASLKADDFAAIVRASVPLDNIRTAGSA